MTEKTHAVGSLVFATGAFLIMDKCNMLDTQIVKIAQYGIITPYALWGAQIPDFDQDNPNRIVTNPVNRLIMDLFKVLGAKHRGIISHVLPIFLSGIVCLLMQLSIITFGMHKLSLDVLHLMLLGLFLGLLSHLILDMCTKDKFDATALAGDEVVVFENLYHNDIEVWSHCDLEDDSQTVSYPSLNTYADCNGEKELPKESVVDVKDTLSYSKLPKGKYTVVTSAVDKDTKELVTFEGGKTEVIDTFTLKDKKFTSGTFEAKVKIDTTGYEDHSIVFVERVYEGDTIDKDHLIAEHYDLSSKDQTVFVRADVKTGDSRPIIWLICAAVLLSAGIIFFTRKKIK